MSSDSPEPENYSISEMVDRLKEQRSAESRSNGELVTRADGTQAIKVRGRKRRSAQPEKDKKLRSRRTRAFQLVGAVLLVFLLLAAAGGVVLYMNGSPYRNKVIDHVTQVTGATAEMTQFRVTPVGATAQTLTLAWPETQPLRKISLQGLNAELNFSSFLRDAWSGEDLTAQKGEMSVDAAAAGATETKDVGEYFRFKGLRCPDLTLHFGGNGGVPAMSLLHSEVSLYPTSKSGRPELHLTGGKVRFRKGLGELVLDRATIGITGRQLSIVSMRLQDPARDGADAPVSDSGSRASSRQSSEPHGEIALSGPVDSLLPGRVSTLDMTVKEFPLEDLIGADMGSLLSGSVDSRGGGHTNFLSFDPASADSARFEMAFSGNSKMVFARLPFLSRLAALLKDTGYEKPVIESTAVRGAVRINSGEITLDDLQLEVKSRMSIHGVLSLAPDHKLSGRLEVGVPLGLVVSDAGLDRVFGPPKGEMRWVTVAISGTAAIPSDDFDKQMAAQSGAREGVPASDFEKLTQPR